MLNKKNIKRKSYKLKNIWIKNIKINNEESFTFKGFKLLFSDLYRNGRNGRKKVWKFKGKNVR